LLSLICPWHCSHRGTETGAAGLSCHLKLQRYIRGSLLGASGSLLRKCERLQIARSQNGFAWKGVAQPHLPMALLAQRHRDWGCFLVLPPQTSDVCWEWGGHCRSPFAALLLKCKRLQIARSQKGLAWKDVAQPHLPMALLAQRHTHWVCLLVLPHQTSNVAPEWVVRAGRLQQTCSEYANVSR